jgi:arylsulfatase A-like enzyme
MNRAQGEPVKLARVLLTGLKWGILWGFAFALTESLYSTLRGFEFYTVQGVALGVKLELESLAIYVPPVFALTLILSMLFFITQKIWPRIRAVKHQDVILSGVLVWLLVFIIMESFAPPVRLWAMFLSAAGLLAGAGAGVVLAWLKKRPVPNQPSRILTLLVLSGFALNHGLLTLLLSTRLHIYPLILAVMVSGVAAAVFFALGWKWIHSKKHGLKYVWLTIFFILILSPLSVHQWKKPVEQEGAPAANPVNVIVIIADACRTDALGIYGGDNVTPNLDRMAREGVIFTRAISQAPWTLPSMLSAISSRYPAVVQRGRFYKIPLSFTILPEVLHSSGYFTKMLMGNYSLGKASGFVQGFDEYEVFNHFFRLQRLLPLPMFFKLHYLYRRAFDLPLTVDLTELISRKANKFLNSPDLPSPFLLWLHYMDPHGPYNPPDRFVKRNFHTQLRKPFAPNNPWHIKGDYYDPQGEDIRTGMIHLSHEDRAFLQYLYSAEVRYIDEKIGELLNLLKDKGLDKNTLVIFTADHGEEFWEHGDWGHGQSLYQELIHVPLIVWGANLQPEKIEDPVALIDLAPSLLESLGLPVPAEFQGESLLGLFRGEPKRERGMFSEATRHFEEMKSIQDESYKLIWRHETKRYELYDLHEDEAETKNIYSPEHPAFKRFENELWPWADKNLLLQKRVSGRESLPGQDEELKRRLEALGYIK